MYGTVDAVEQRFSGGQWDPTTGQPDTSTVTGWLATYSQSLDGEIGTVVAVPVDPSGSPNLAAGCDLIVTLRVAAEVYDLLYPASDTGQGNVRTSKIWRDEAARLVKGIQAGHTGDGEPLEGSTPATVGGPLGDETAAPNFTIGQQY